MKKISKRRLYLRNKKNLKRKRKCKGKKHIKRIITGKFADWNINRGYSMFLREMQRQNFIGKQYVCKKNENVIAPKIFSFKDNFNECINFYKTYLSSYIYGNGHYLYVDFSSCEKVDVANFSFFDICTRKLNEFKTRYNSSIYSQVYKIIDCIPSRKNVPINRYLHAFKYRELNTEFVDNTRKFYPLPLLSGKSKSHYSQNMKNVACQKITTFVDNSGSPFGVNLSQSSKNALEGFVAEVLDNAESHSLKNSEWYVSGVSFNFPDDRTEYIEVNLSIMNIGKSMFEGFEDTKQKNKDTYLKLEKLYKEHEKLFSINNKFDKEALFTLYMLNDGVSRLKYKDESRGNGTIKYINSFINIGAYGNTSEKYEPQLNVISGKTILTCDYKYKPFQKTEDIQQISLNKSKNIHELPDKKNLKSYNIEFPGTILETKVYLNKDIITNRVNNGN